MRTDAFLVLQQKLVTQTVARPECIICTTNSDENQRHFLWEWSKSVLNFKLRTFGFHYEAFHYNEQITTQLDIELSIYCDWLIAMTCIGMETRCFHLYSSPAHKETTLEMRPSSSNRLNPPLLITIYGTFWSLFLPPMFSSFTKLRFRWSFWGA